jgi:Tol biopolymer transport system component
VAAALWRPKAPGESLPTLQHLQLTSAGGFESEPSLSPDGKWFLFVSDADGNPDIYLQSVSGQTAINLTKDSPAADGEPAFSPDGERIAFRSERAGGGLYIMGRTGEAPRRITSEGFDPAWSPDGRHLVYGTATFNLATSRATLSQLRSIQIDTGQITALTDQDAANPAWSPNGRFIAYWGLGRTVGGSEISSVRDLWVIPSAGGAPWRVTDDPAVDWCPMWNADGSFLYFVSDRGGSMNLWRLPMNAGTGRPTGSVQPVTTPAGYVGRARMSAAGGHLVYEARSAIINVHRASFDAARATIGSLEAVTTGSRAFRFVDPSPDGKFLVLGTGYLQQEDLFISAVDGSGLRQLTTDAFYDRWPQWSPDGTRMTFTDITNRRAVVMFDPRKPWKDQTPDVLPVPAGDGSYLSGLLQWSPDGTKLAGDVNGIVTIYDTASHRYRPVGNVRGAVFAWLRDGRLFVGPPEAPRLVHSQTGAASAVSMPTLGADAPTDYRLSRDERSVYFPVGRNESDIWLVELVKEPTGR